MGHLRGESPLARSPPRSVGAHDRAAFSAFATATRLRLLDVVRRLATCEPVACVFLGRCLGERAYKIGCGGPLESSPDTGTPAPSHRTFRKTPAMRLAAAFAHRCSRGS